MAVQLIVIGMFAKLAISVVLTHRTRLWWTPGAGILVFGTAFIAATRGPWYAVAAVVLGVGALAIGNVLHRRALAS